MMKKTIQTLVLLLLLGACAQSTSINPTANGNIPTAAFSTASKALSVWVAPELKGYVNLPGEIVQTEDEEAADLRVVVGKGQVVGVRTYALVAPFPTIADGVTTAELRRAWLGKASGTYAGQPLLMDATTLAVMESWWGPAGEQATMVLPAEALLEHAWAQELAWAIIPFEELEPRWKTLTVGGMSPLWKGYDAEKYALRVPISLAGEAELAAEAAAAYGAGSERPLVAANREAGKLTTVVMTGVTALARATAWEMENKGILYPAQDVGALLREGDLTHVSNEVSFAEDCPPPKPTRGKLRFCSDPAYIELLEYIGVDIVELTGDHILDWSKEAFHYTLDIYTQLGWPYYGGGANLAEARRAITVEHNGNRLAFIGCNAKSEVYAGASETQPGAAACDMAWINAETSRLNGEGYLTIVTFQHAEYYLYPPQAVQMRDFRLAAAGGAVIVSGSQAHQAQGMEFYGPALVMYGLGNLFFDQIHISEDTGKALIARHVFYAGRHIGTELFTTVFVDYARPRFMTAEERAAFLAVVFGASIWGR